MKRATWIVSTGVIALVALAVTRRAPQSGAATSTPEPEAWTAPDTAPSRPSSSRASPTSSTRPRPGASIPLALAPSPAPRESAAVSTPAAPTLSPFRAPVIDAIRSSATRGEQKRRAILDAIRSSGESDEPWTAEAEVAFESWTDAMPGRGHKTMLMSEPICYAAGCVADVTFPDEATHRAAAQAFRTLEETNAGHGGRVQTPAERSGDKVIASWIMLRPVDP